MHILGLVLQMRKLGNAHGYFSYGSGEAVPSLLVDTWYTSCDPTDTGSRYRNINTRILRWVSFATHSTYLAFYHPMKILSDKLPHIYIA